MRRKVEDFERKQEPQNREESVKREPNRELRPQREKDMDPPAKPRTINKYDREY